MRQMSQSDLACKCLCCHLTSCRMVQHPAKVWSFGWSGRDASPLRHPKGV